ncbi:MAG TPA: helix-hairpin-helix domain-containing protein, partial [bacterium]|nr:helix-hairpin-helix domain-containing protein [bacterium]
EIKKKFSVEFSGTGVSDFFMLRKQGEIQFFAVARYHDGALNSLRTFTVTAITDEIESSVASALATFYSGNSKAEKIFIYPNVLSNEQIEQVSGFNVRKSGAIPKTIMKILETNIDSAMKNYIRDTQSRGIMLNELSEFVNAEVTSIMCLDISTFGGEFTVAGAVWWEKGKFVKNNYRKFRIRTVEGIDDFGSLKEVASRLMKKWKENSFPVPSLLLIDGGAGQVSSVYSVVGEFLPIAGIIKDRRNLKGHELLINTSGEEMLLNDSIFALTMKSIRDETHRFSISFNKNLRITKLTSALAQIEGIGKSRELALLQHFRTIANIRSATIEELMEVKGISRDLAQKIISVLNG